LTPASLCPAFAQPTHLDVESPTLGPLSPAQRAAVAGVDRMRHVEPRVMRCDRNGDVVVFDKESALAPGAPRQRLFGAVRFLGAPYSTFQLVAGGAAPDPGLLEAMAGVVRSFTVSAAE
jgi:hypothetical protein